MAQKRYYSGINYALFTFILIALVVPTIGAIKEYTAPVLILNVVILGFFIHLYATTYYVIKENVLIIRAGFIIRYKVEINRIREIVKTRSLLSSPALSLNRLLIKTETGPYIISPKKKEQMAFINHLLSINTAIKTDIIKK